MTREDFIKSSGRVFFLSLMLFGTGVLVRRRRISLSGSCDDNSRCGSCRINASCRDPEKQTTANDGKQSS